MKRTAAFLAAFLFVTACPIRALPQVLLYGEPGTFGSLGGTLPSGQSLTLVPHSQFNVTRGRGAFFTATTSDGTLFAAGFHHNGNNLLFTSCYVNITCLNPSAPTCYDAATGQNRNSSEILVLTRDGYPSIPRDESLCLQPSTRFTIGAGGVDLSDIQTVRTEAGEELVAFLSASASLGNSDINGFPTLGFLHKQNGSWRLDPSRQFWRDDLANSSAAGQAACPSANCGGAGEMAFFSQSHALVYGSYFSQKVVVVDLDGVVQAQYEIPDPGNRCTPDPNDVVPWVGVRQVDTDPTAPLGDERAAITVDGTAPFSHPIQEFRYDDATKALEPVTNMVGTSSGTEPLADCTAQGQNSNYDADGNLIVNSTRDGKAVFHVYMKDPLTGRRSIEDNCPFTGYTEATFGAACLADLSTGWVVGFDPSTDVPIWDYAGFNLVSSQVDPNNRILSRYDTNGFVDFIDTFRSNDRTIYVSYAPVNLQSGALPLQGYMTGLAPWKGVLDTTAKSLWLPVAPLVPPVDPACSAGIFCDLHANYDYPSWLYEVKYEQVLDGGLRVLDAWIDRPYIDTSKSALIGFFIRANTNSVTKSSQSGFWLFPKGSAQPVLERQVSRGSCSAGNCNYKAQFHQSLLDGQPPGEYRWSLVMTSNATGETVHAQGVIELQ